MLRKIVRIDPELCTGCGECARACHEGAIELVNGKAILARENYCDGLGDCLPACPAGAISFEEREAPAYDEAAVKASKSAAPRKLSAVPGTQTPTGLTQWPVQLKLLPPRAPFYDGADVLVAADCTAYACGDFHERFMTGRVTLIGCPKLDAIDYAEKLAQIFTQNDIRSVTVTRMQVPCCGGLENAVKRAIAAAGKALPLEVITLTADGRIL